MTARSDRRNTPTASVPPTPAFVGRGGALDTIVSTLRSGSAMVVVEGEAGIGKTRLLREALVAVEGSTRGAILLATCPAVPEPAPLSGIVSGIRRLRPALGDLGLSPLAGALRPLFPEWAAELPPPLDHVGDPRAVRHMLFRALTELVERLGVTTLVVEDVHWADAATLEWLLTLCADEPGGPWPSIVVSFRPWDVPSGSLLRRLTTRTPPGMRRVRIELTALDVSDVRQFVADTYGTDDVSDKFAEFLHGVTGGIPLVVQEYLLLLEEREDIVRKDGEWIRRALSELEVPATVRESVLERAHRLDRDTRRILGVASVVAQPTDETVLSAVADLDIDRTRTGLSGALASGLLQESTAGQFGFRHVLDAQAIYDAIAPPDRRYWHGRAVAVLEGHDHPPVARLAHHCREAGDLERWCFYAEASADLAMESGDDRTAVETLLQVLDSDGLPLRRRVRLARALGQAAFFGAATLGELVDRVVQRLRDVLDVDDLAGPDRGELRLLLGRMLWAAGEKPAAFECWEAAVPDLGHRPDLALRAMSNMGLPLIPGWSASRHRQWLDRAGELAESAAPADRQAYLSMRLTALLLLGDPSGWDELDALPRAVSTPESGRDLAATLVNAAWAILVWGRYEDARRQLTVAERHIHESQYARLMSHALTTRTHLDWYGGMWAGLSDRAAAVARLEEIDPATRLQARQISALLMTAGGAADQAVRELGEVIEGYRALGVIDPANVAASAALARLHLAGGDTARALDATEPVVSMITAKGTWLWLTDIAPTHVDALIAAARTAEAEAFVAELAAEIDGRELPPIAAAVGTCVGILAAARGDAERAAQAFGDAAAAWATLPRPYDELLCRERQGASLLAADGREEAVQLLTQTQERLHALGARWDADRVAAVVRDHGGEVSRAWRGGRRGYGDQLSPRELDVVRLVVRGHTNRQVAGALFLSTRTVEGHVRSAMRKLGVSSRTALVVAAIDRGYVTRGADAVTPAE